MSGRSGRSHDHGGRGKSDRSGCGRGQSNSGARKTPKSGLWRVFYNNVFDYGHKAAADPMSTSWEKLIQYVGTTFGQDISNEHQKKTTMILTEPRSFTQQ
jgi:hypothetical protein